MELQTLRLLQSGQILHVFTRLALHEFVHLELIMHPRLLALTSRWNHEAPVRVQQTGKTSHERGTNLIWSESCGTDDTDGIDTSAVGKRGAACGMLDRS